MTAPAVFRFSRFELRPHEHRLLVDGEPAVLGSRAMAVLQALAERPGQLVTKQQLMDIAWPGAVVTENNVAAQISAVRKVLGPDIIATVAGRGYRLTTVVEQREQAASFDSPAWPCAARGAVVAAADPGLAPLQTKLRTNLPPVLPALLGRDADLSALDGLVQRHRLLTIVGPGGMGKSLLAQHLLDSRRAAYAHGVCWVELAAVDNPAALSGAVAAALGLETGTGDALAGLTQAVGPLQLLLVLDNAEHLLADVAQLAQVLHDAAPGLHTIVTSQAPLRLPLEQLMRLGPLAVPERPLPACEALAFGAVALFEQRARAVDRRFVLTDANTAAVIGLCSALDGLPLAIELAAARAPLMGPQWLVASLSERLKLLTANANRWAPLRQQTLRAAMEWSHGLLTGREQTVFRRLALMVGSASLELVQQVVARPDGTSGADALDAWGALDALQILIDRSLVVAVPGNAPGTAPRYRLLESPRLYALERLEVAGELETVSRLHAQAVAAQFGGAWSTLWDGSIGTGEWASALEADFDNARSAFNWAQAQGDAVTALTIGRSLLHALPRSRHADRMSLAGACAALIGPAVPSLLRLQSLLTMSSQWIDTRPARSQVATQEALVLARQLQADGGDAFWLYFALSQSAAVLARQGERTAAESLLTEMRGLEHHRWPAQRLAIGTAAEYVFARVTGNVSSALHFARRHLALRRAAGTSGYLSLSNLIDAEVEAGELQAAVETGAALLAQLEGSREEHGLSYARINVMGAWLALGNPVEARALARAGWRNARRFEQMPYWADYLALLAAQEGRYRAAAQILGFSDRVYALKEAARDGNEARAFQQASRLAHNALGDEFARLRDEGAVMGDGDIGLIALAAQERNISARFPSVRPTAH